MVETTGGELESSIAALLALNNGQRRPESVPDAWGMKGATERDDAGRLRLRVGAEVMAGSMITPSNRAAGSEEIQKAAEEGRKARLRESQVALLQNIELPDIASKIIEGRRAANKAFLDHVREMLALVRKQLDDGEAALEKLCKSEDDAGEQKVKLTHAMIAQTKPIVELLSALLAPVASESPGGGPKPAE